MRINTPQLFDRRSFLKNSALAFAAATVGSGVLVACGSGDSGSSGGGSGGGNEKVTYLSILPLETLSLAPELLGVAGGYFAKHGLDVELQATKGSAQAIQTLLSGVGLVTRIGQIDLMAAVTKANQPLVNIGTLNRTTMLRFVYSKKNHPIEKPEDMVGKTMGVPSEGGTSDNVVSLVLANAGIDPGKVKRQVVGLTPGTFNLVEQGRIVGYVVSTDTANILKAQNPDVGVFEPAEWVKADSQVYATTKSALQEKGETIRKFMAGLRDAVAAMVADESLDETIKVLRSKYSFSTLNDDNIAKQSLQMARESWLGDEGPDKLLVTNEERWAAGYKELADAGMVTGGADPKPWFDNSFLPNA